MDKKAAFWHIKLYYFKKGKNITEMQKKKFVQCMGKGPVTDWMCPRWFVEFCVEDFSLDDVPQSGRPVVDSNKIEILIESNQHYIMQEIVNILKTSKSSCWKSFVPAWLC